jgi:hypothetical protein
VDTLKPSALLAKMAILGANHLGVEEPDLFTVPRTGRNIDLDAVDEELTYGY